MSGKLSAARQAGEAAAAAAWATGFIVGKRLGRAEWEWDRERLDDEHRAEILQRAADTDVAEVQARAISDGGDTAEQIMEAAIVGLYRSEDGDV